MMESEDIDIENDSAEAITTEPPRSSDVYEETGIVQHRNPVAVSILLYNEFDENTCR